EPTGGDAERHLAALEKAGLGGDANAAQLLAGFQRGSQRAAQLVAELTDAPILVPAPGSG
ncbi:MAG TPA: hypothetical protein VFB52_04235, partial [Solirubrobacterales bacterium]|nr:hypothetical protein [Solirubrobacterales bacterium]